MCEPTLGLTSTDLVTTSCHIWAHWISCCFFFILVQPPIFSKHFKWFWCLNVTKQRVKAELANNTQTVVFQLRFVWSMRSPPSTVWQILLIIYTVVGTAGHDFVIVWWDCIVFGVVCSLCFLCSFCFSCLTMHIIACSYQVVDILISILVTVCQISFFFLLFLIWYLQSASQICSHDLHYSMD